MMLIWADILFLDDFMFSYFEYFQISKLIVTVNLLSQNQSGNLLVWMLG